jgi:hypothetical protein
MTHQIARSRALRLPAGAILLAILLPILAGCAAAPRLFVNREADMTLYKRVSVLPFANLTSDPYASGRVTRAFTTELIITGRFDLTDPSMLTGELDKISASPGPQGNVDIAKLREAANKVGATAVIRGAVNEYTMRRSGTDEYPVVAFDAEMVDVATGIVVWRISLSESGRGRLPVVGGAGERTFARATQEACEKAVRVLRAKAL